MLDTQIDIKDGKIFIWHKYHFFECEEKERRWFVCLGNCIITEITFQVTTTTST